MTVLRLAVNQQSVFSALQSLIKQKLFLSRSSRSLYNYKCIGSLHQPGLQLIYDFFAIIPNRSKTNFLGFMGSKREDVRCLALEPLVYAVVLDMESMVDVRLDEEGSNRIEDCHCDGCNERSSSWNDYSRVVHKPITDPMCFCRGLERETDNSSSSPATGRFCDFEALKIGRYYIVPMTLGHAKPIPLTCIQFLAIIACRTFAKSTYANLGRTLDSED
jgi:hypothetical protein